MKLSHTNPHNMIYQPDLTPFRGICTWKVQIVGVKMSLLLMKRSTVQTECVFLYKIR